MALSASKAWMSRRSILSASGTCIACQCAPSIVRSTVPLVPLAQATVSLTTERPRSSALVPLDWACQDWAAAGLAARSAAMREVDVRRDMEGDIGGCGGCRYYTTCLSVLVLLVFEKLGPLPSQGQRIKR
jgi:hypothetical protein